MKNRKLLYSAIVILALLICGYIWQKDIKDLLTYGFGDKPTHELTGSCDWEKKVFSKITLFEQDCTDPSLESPLFENNDGTILETKKTEYGVVSMVYLARHADKGVLSIKDIAAHAVEARVADVPDRQLVVVP